MFSSGWIDNTLCCVEAQRVSTWMLELRRKMFLASMTVQSLVLMGVCPRS